MLPSRRFEVVADGLTLWRGAQLAVAGEEQWQAKSSSPVLVFPR